MEALSESLIERMTDSFMAGALFHPLFNSDPRATADNVGDLDELHGSAEYCMSLQGIACRGTGRALAL